MGWKAKYYEVFGLTETATKSDVKRKYRKLAMKFHPDKNPDPKAHKLFLDLTEAYHILMDDSVARPTQNIRETGNTKSAAEQREERYKQGQERYQQYLKNKKIQSERNFQNFTSGIRWKIFKISAIICLNIGVLLFVDFVLPTRVENHIIVSDSSNTRSYAGLQYDNMTEVRTDKKLSMYLAEFKYTAEIREWPVIEVRRSMIFHNPVVVKHEYNNVTRYFQVDFSVVNLFPILTFLLLIPGLTFIYKRNSPSFYMAYFISQYVLFLFVIYILLSHQRWLHLLTMGLL